MADSKRPSERTSRPKGTPGALTPDVVVTNEDRVVAGPNGPERIAGGYSATATSVFDPHMDAGRKRTGATKDFNRGEKPNRQNDHGEMADLA